MRITHSHLAGTALALVLTAFAAVPAAAQDAGGDIVVTARRVSENLLDVPMSVGVLTAETITSANIVDTQQAVKFIPGVTIVTGTAEVGDTQVNIRGVNGSRDAESNVALVVDGVQINNINFLNMPMGTLTQFEVVKGPQGAYYGRNATAGAINITTAKPGKELGGSAQVGVANHGTFTGRAEVSVPLSPDTGFLVNGFYRNSNGFFQNDGPIIGPGANTIDNYDGGNINVRFVSQINDKLEIDIKGGYSTVTSGSINYNVVFNLPNFAGINPAFNLDVNDQDFYYDSNYPTWGKQTAWIGSAKATYDLDFAQLVGSIAYTSSDAELAADGTVAAFGFFNGTSQCQATVASLHAQGYTPQAPQTLGSVPTNVLFDPNGSLLSAFGATTCDGTQYQQRSEDDFSIDVRMISNSTGAFKWTAGGTYPNINRTTGVNVGWDKGLGITRNLYNDQTSSNPTEQLSHDEFTTNAFALFGTVDWEFARNVTLAVALRYDNESRDVHNLVDPAWRNQWINGGNQPLNPGLIFGPLVDKSQTYDKLQPKISLTWNASDDWTVYGNWGIGWKAGGFNNQGSKATIDAAFNNPLINAGLNIYDDYQPETSSAFEVGVKGQALDGRLTLTAAGYINNVTDMQFFEFFVGSFGILRVVSNIDKVNIKGFEAGATFKILPGWSMYAGGNYNDSEITENNARPRTVGGKSPYTSLYTINAGTDWNVPVNDKFNFVGRADLRVTGPTWFSTAQTADYATVFNAILPLAGLPAFLGTANYSNSERDTFTTVDVRAGFTYGDAWRVEGWATNLFNAHTIAEVLPAPEFGGSFASPGARQAFGLDVTFSF